MTDNGLDFIFIKNIKIKIIEIIGLTLITIPEQKKLIKLPIDIRMPRFKNPLFYAVTSPKL